MFKVARVRSCTRAVAATNRSKSESARPLSLAHAFKDAKCFATPESTGRTRNRSLNGTRRYELTSYA